jgi:hypothetical protein
VRSASIQPSIDLAPVGRAAVADQAVSDPGAAVSPFIPPPDERLTVDLRPPWWGDRWVCLGAGLVTGLAAGGVLSVLLFQPTARSPAPAWSILLPALLVVLLWQVLPRPAYARSLVVRSRSLMIARTDGSTEELAAHGVTLVALRRAPALRALLGGDGEHPGDGARAAGSGAGGGGGGGGEGGFLAPRLVRVVSEQDGGREWSLRLRAEQAIPVFAALSQACAGAVLIDADGRPLLPSNRLSLDPAGARAAADVVIRREFGGRARLALAGGAALALAAAALGILLSMLEAPAGVGGEAVRTGRGVFVVVALAAGAAACFASAARTLARAVRLRSIVAADAPGAQRWSRAA